jgi:hypothetical protein
VPWLLCRGWVVGQPRALHIHATDGIRSGAYVSQATMRHIQARLHQICHVCRHAPCFIHHCVATTDSYLAVVRPMRRAVPRVGHAPCKFPSNERRSDNENTRCVMLQYNTGNLVGTTKIHGAYDLNDIIALTRTSHILASIS